MKNKAVMVLLVVYLVVGQLTPSTTERIILDEIKLGWASIKITATTRDATVTEKMLFVENAREEDVKLYMPERYHGLIYQIGDVKIISGKYYQEPTTSTTTTTILKRGCCVNGACDIKAVGCRISCYTDKDCLIGGPTD